MDVRIPTTGKSQAKEMIVFNEAGVRMALLAVPQWQNLFRFSRICQIELDSAMRCRGDPFTSKEKASTPKFRTFYQRLCQTAERASVMLVKSIAALAG